MKENSTKLPPAQRVSVILSAAVKVANEKGLSEVTFKTVAANCLVRTTPRTVSHYYKIGDLRRAVISDERANDTVKVDAVTMGIQV
jgi:AcrR family transcriptional regulator